jgi:hypothetical protein
VLFDQLDDRYPNRSRASDGTIGDAAHASRDSDHNLWYPPPKGGLVTAGDFTHDPANGPDINRLSDELAASRDPRIKFMIANALIMDTRPGFSPWRWVPYRGSNKHTSHLHLSVMDNSLCEDPRLWDLPMLGGRGTFPVPLPPSGNHGSIPDIEVGDRGPLVLKLQQWLNRMFPAYSKLVADGIYGPATADVLKQFQRRAGVVGGDGENIGPQTKAALWRLGFRP